MWRRNIASFLLGLMVLVPLVTSRQQLHSPTFRSVPTTVRSRETQTVVLPCIIENLGTSTVRWWRGEALLAERTALDTSPLRSPLVSRIILRTDNSLEVSDLEGADAGAYVCQVASLPPSLPIKQTHSIEVLFPPTVSILPDTDMVTVKLGEEVNVLCQGEGVPTPAFTWVKQVGEWPEEENGQVIQQSPRLQFTAEGREDAGVYECIASNLVGNPASISFRLTVQHPPEVKAEKAWVHTSPTSRAQLTCIVYAEPFAHVEWLRPRDTMLGSGDDEMPEEEIVRSPKISRLVSGERYSLLFKGVRVSDLGNYTCRAKNALGVAEASLQLSGVAKTAVIKIDPLMATENSFTLIWEVDSSSPVFEYLLQFKKQNSNTWVNLTVPAAVGARSTTFHSHSFTLRGLESGTLYDTQLSARNTYGWNSPSTITSFSTLGPGEIPTEIVETDEEQVDVSEPEIVIKKVETIDKKPTSPNHQNGLKNAAPSQYKLSTIQSLISKIISVYLLYHYL